MQAASAKKILILGYGEMGHAMEYLLKKRQTLFIWDRYPADGFKPVDLMQSVPQADILLFCLPVNPHREVLSSIRCLLKPGSLCLSIAKGLDEEGNAAYQIFQQSLPPDAYALLYGPMISEQIRAGRPAFAQLGCSDEAVFEAVRPIFKGSRLYLERSSDSCGISWSVILKNVYAMLFGISDELGLGDNMRGYLAVASLRELDSIVRRMGGESGSPFHLAGLGDLITTATSEDSHHHELGRRLARGETEDLTGEGIHTLQMVKRHRLFRLSDYPLFSLIDGIVERPERIKKRLEGFLAHAFHESQ